MISHTQPWKVILYGLIAVLMLVSSAPAIKAEEESTSVETYLRFKLLDSQVLPGDVFEVQMRIVGATELYGLQVNCQVDPNILVWQSAQFEDFFTEPIIGSKNLDPVAGTWIGAISQKNPAPALSGDGVFAIFTFEAVAAGVSKVACEPLASDRDGHEMAISVRTRQITVESETEVTGAVDGLVTYQGRLQHAGISLEISGETTQSTQTDSQGRFAALNLRDTNYGIKADAPLYLPLCALATIENGWLATLAATDLAGGDVDDSDAIKINDATLIGSNFGLSAGSAPAMDARADINADGEVNVKDLSILGSNFSKAGCQEWLVEKTTVVDPAPTGAEEDPEMTDGEGGNELEGLGDDATANDIPLVNNCNPSNGSGGLGPGLHLTKVAGLNASVIVGPDYDPSRPTHLSFFFHGDSGLIWKKFSEKATHPMTKFVLDRNWILVAPEAPNGYSWWKDYQGDHIRKAADMFDEMFAKYNVCRDTIIGGSGSGGGVFWAGQFFPAKGDQYQAHMVLACGASVANSTDRKLIRALGTNPEIVARSSFYHIYGTEDSQVSQQTVEGNMAMYREEGFRVAGEKLVGAGHCNEWTDQGFPGMKEQLVEQWGILATELGIN